MNKTPQTTSPLNQLDPQTTIENQSLDSSSRLSLATGNSLEPDSTRSLVNLPTVPSDGSADTPPGTTGLPLALASDSTVVSALDSTGALATSSTSPLVVPALTLPPYLDITSDWRNYCESLGALILAEYLACELDPFWMLTIRPPKNWSKERIGQSIKEAAVEYHRRTYKSRSFDNDDFVYYAAILWSHRSKRWHAHILTQRLPLYPDLLVLCFKKAINRYAGTVDLQNHEDLRTDAAQCSDWLDRIQPDVDYRTYIAGRRNITGHYGWDPERTRESHVDLYSPVLKHCRARERLVIVAETAATVLAATSGSQQTVPGKLLLGRRLLRGMRLESCTLDDRFGMTALYHTFRDDQGLSYRWNGSNPEPVNVRGRLQPGRYRLIPGVPLDFRASVFGHWPDGTIRISRPYFRLDGQPEATRVRPKVQYPSGGSGSGQRRGEEQPLVRHDGAPCAPPGDVIDRRAADAELSRNPGSRSPGDAEFFSDGPHVVS